MKQVLKQFLLFSTLSTEYFKHPFNISSSYHFQFPNNLNDKPHRITWNGGDLVIINKKFIKNRGWKKDTIQHLFQCRPTKYKLWPKIQVLSEFIKVTLQPIPEQTCQQWKVFLTFFNLVIGGFAPEPVWSVEADWLILFLLCFFILWCVTVGLREVLRHGSQGPVAVRDWVLYFFGQLSVAADEKEWIIAWYGYFYPLHDRE